jgi:Na+/phosphate symporter
LGVPITLIDFAGFAALLLWGVHIVQIGVQRTFGLPPSNLLNRALGVSAALVALPYVGPWIIAIEPDGSRAVTDFHTAFNLALALLFFPLLKPYAGLLRRWMPAQISAGKPGHPMYFDSSARETLVIALSAAAREAPPPGGCSGDYAARFSRYVRET